MHKSLLNLLAIRFGCQVKAAGSAVMLRLFGFIMGMTLSTAIYAVGMGGINVDSSLGQVLEADIELVAVSKEDRAELVARLASPEVYRAVGLEYSYGNKFNFKIESRADGEPYLKVTSSQPINDPFVVMLVELTWPSGRLQREYTFLLDPPGYVAELPTQAKVKPVAPVVQPIVSVAVPEMVPEEEPVVTQVVEPVIPDEEVIPSEPVTQSEEFDFIEPDEGEVSSEPVARIDTSEEQAELLQEEAVMDDVAEQNEEWIAVERGDTLSRLAIQYKPTEVSLERMLVAMYRANVKEFDAKNMNRIKAGKILRMPTQQEIDEVKQSDAVREIRAQVVDWNAYRQKLAGATSVSAQPQAMEQVATGKLSSSVADKAPVAKESAGEVLKLSRGEAPGDQAGGGGKSVSSEEEGNNAAVEDAIAEAKSSDEVETRTVALEKNLQEMERLAELKTAAAALAQQPAEAAKKIEELNAAKPKPVVKPKQPPAKQELSLLDQILSEPLYLAGGALVLVLLGGLGLIANRRRNKSSDEGGFENPNDLGSKPGGIVSPVSSPESGDFTGMNASQSPSDEQFMDADPISEADLFLNFGRDAQAEEILKDALQSTPDNHKIHLKLLEIYASRKDADSFATIMSQLQNSGDEEAIQLALTMGQEMDQSNPLFGDTDAHDSHTNENEAATKTPEVDFDLDAPFSGDSTPSPEDDFLNDAVKTVAMSAAAVVSPEDEFLSEDDKTLAMNSSQLDAEPTEVMSFDSASSAESVGIETEKSSAPDLGDLIFEVTGSHPVVQATAEGEDVELPKIDDISLNTLDSTQSAETVESDVGQPKKADEEAMEFTLDFPGEDKTENTKAATQPAETDFAAIDLNFEADEASKAPETESESKDERWQEAATKLDLAKAYQEMGDASGAREILEEVLREGDDEQRKAAQAILSELD